MQYVIIVEKAENNWSAYVPDVWGCVATGATREEVERNIREALEFHFESMAEDGDPLPEPGTWTTVVDVAIPAEARFAPRTERAKVAGA
jgi:predicted RNase H-like HicB family nuclease